MLDGLQYLIKKYICIVNIYYINKYFHIINRNKNNINIINAPSPFSWKLIG